MFCYKKITHYKANLTALAELVSQKKTPAILGGHKQTRFSYFCYGPTKKFSFGLGEKDFFNKFKKTIGQFEKIDKSDLPEGLFVGGWIGWLGYELGRYIEKIPETAIDDIGLPLVRLSYYDKVICFDNKYNCFYLLSLEGKAGIAELEELLKRSQNIEPKKFGPCDIENIDTTSIKCNMTQTQYENAFKKIINYIYEGDVYQINFSQRFDIPFTGNSIDMFNWQNTFNPSLYSAYIASDDFAIVSASPEMFITKIGDKISTKPIKGTRRRVKDDPVANRAAYQDLLSCEKEKAELNMIIDLERNDLGRICQYGTIKVSQTRTIEEYPTVFHGVATVEGLLRPEITLSDIIKAMFPGGSITGAPKIRSMEIIDELEPTCRGVYTGAIGFIGADGDVCLNIAIRTVIIKNRKAYVQVGGGIVADSDYQSEWNETITKGRALIAGINSV